MKKMLIGMLCGVSLTASAYTAEKYIHHRMSDDGYQRYQEYPDHKGIQEMPYVERRTSQSYSSNMEVESVVMPVNGISRYYLDVTAGPLFMTVSRLEKIYGRTWPSFQAKWSFAFSPKEGDMFPLFGWISAGHTAKSGRSIGGREKTKIRMTPVGCGMRVIKALDQDQTIVALHAGIGIQAYFVKITNDSNFVPREQNKRLPAGVLDCGLYVQSMEHLAFTVDLDFSFGRMSRDCSNGSTNVVTRPVRINNVGLRAGLALTF